MAKKKTELTQTEMATSGLATASQKQYDKLRAAVESFARELAAATF